MGVTNIFLRFRGYYSDFTLLSQEPFSIFTHQNTLKYAFGSVKDTIIWLFC